MIQIKYNVLPNHLSNGVAANFPDCNWEWWHKYSDNNSYKYGSLDRLRFPRICQVALDQLAISLSHTIDTVFPKGFIDFEHCYIGIFTYPNQHYVESSNKLTDPLCLDMASFHVFAQFPPPHKH